MNPPTSIFPPTPVFDKLAAIGFLAGIVVTLIAQWLSKKARRR